ncbi:MAG: hypothetical protein Q9160_007029 [Pyrenula sp. 1 TL-2023]
MGGPGSGGFKNSPGDIDVHEAWEVLDQDPNNNQKLPIVRCRYCYKSHARHTSRQRTHLLTCNAYLSAMATQGVSNTITRAAADPELFSSSATNNTPSKQHNASSSSPHAHTNANSNGPLPHPAGANNMPTVTRKALKASSSSHHIPSMGQIQRFQEHPLAIKIQALALAEANLSESYILECTGVNAHTLTMLRRVARERGLDPSKNRALREEYVTNLPLSGPAGLETPAIGYGSAGGGVGPVAGPVTPTMTPTMTPVTGIAAGSGPGQGRKRQRTGDIIRDREREGHRENYRERERERDRDREDVDKEVNGEEDGRVESHGGEGRGGSTAPGAGPGPGPGPGRGGGGLRAPPGYLGAETLPPGNWNFTGTGFS